MEEAIVIRNMDTRGKRADKYNEALEDWFGDDKITQNWILDKIDRGEQIAFLAWTRKEVEIMQEAIDKLLKKKGLPVATKQADGTWTKGVRAVTLMAKKQNTYTLMSKLLLLVADKLQNVPTDVTNNAELKKLFKSVIPYRYYTQGSTKKQNVEIAIDNAIDRITREYNPFTKTYGGYLADYKAVLYDVQHGTLTKEQYVAFFKQRLIADEITENSVRNYLNGADTSMEEIKSTDPATKVDIIYSTIHSAKGLEFDNVVICHNNNKRSAHTQEALRLFFVGLSRAKKHELIINGEYNDPYGRSYISTGRSGMLHDPINTAYRRCMANIQMGVRPVSGKLEKDVTEFGLLEDE
jgi:DNA helicase-2/ATP-dependent DNA helicase PcrA